MNYQFKSMNLSLAFHAVLILILLGVNNSLVVTSKLLVIDFTIGDSIKAGELLRSRKGEADIDKKQYQEVRKEKINIQEKEPEIIEPKPEVSPVTQHVSTTEELIPVTAHEEIETDYSKKTDIPENIYMAGSRSGESNGASIAKTGDKIAGSGYSGDSLEQGKIRYLKEHFAYIKEMVQRHITYPDFARKMGWKGKVIISFIVASNGHANNIHIIQSSGFIALDQITINAVKRASPFPKPPVEAKIIIPILFLLN
jgi:protein TonB